MQYPPPKSYLPHSPSCASLCRRGGDEWESYRLLVVQLYEVGHVPDSVMSDWGVMEAVSPGVCAVRPGKRCACVVCRLWAFGTSACANVWHVTVSGLTEVHGAEFSSLSGGQPLLMFPNEPSKIATFPKPIERKLFFSVLVWRWTLSWISQFQSEFGSSGKAGKDS